MRLDLVFILVVEFFGGSWTAWPGRSLGQGVVLEVSLGEGVDADVDVSFGGFEVEVSQESLEDEGVGTRFVHVGCVGVAEAVRAEAVAHGIEALTDSGSLARCVDDPIDGARGEVEDLIC